MDYPKQNISGLVLAGGRGQRMGGEDKGLIEYHGKPLVAHAIDRLKQQVATLYLSANRNINVYQQFGFPLVTDAEPHLYHGPLSGIAAAMRAIETPYLLCVPCDAPRLPRNLGEMLWQQLSSDNSKAAVAHDGQRLQPLCCLLSRDLRESLDAYLDAGERAAHTWLERQNTSTVYFREQAAGFMNINRPGELIY